MIEFYAPIRFVHICAVIVSGSLLLLRGLGVASDNRWAMAAPVRYLSYSVDTILLTAALMLMTVLHQYPFVQAWLTVKLALVIAYVVLGSFALRYGRTRRSRLVFLVGAAMVYGMIVSIARSHNPLGILAG